MSNSIVGSILAGLVLLTGCQSRPTANVQHTSLGIFEVVDCKTSGPAKAVSLKGSTEQYCLAAKPVVDQADVRAAEAKRNPSGQPQLLLLFTIKTGNHMKETTERILAEHQKLGDQGKMAIVLDGTLISVLVLNGSVSDTLLLDGAFAWDDTVQIAEWLNTMPR
ncbi:MAG TPA: hypothetical protein VKZ53_30900 [Candidatus Angelobacter sp.]|nr:hypothetical protein [Candidatus Angelobacter sp.]